MASCSNRISSAGGRLAWLSSPGRGITRGGVTVGRWARGSAIRRPREHADLAHRLCSAASQHAPEAPSPRDQWRRRLSQLIDAMDRGVVELVPAPPACSSRWPQPLSTCVDDIVFAAADDEPAAALKWRKTRVPPEGKGVAGLEPGSVSPLHNQSTARHLHGQRRWLAMMTPRFLGRPRSLEPSVVFALGWCRVARLQALFILHWCWAFVAARYRCAHEWTPGDTWCSLPLLTVRSRIINIDETCCKMLPPLERAWWPHNPMDLPHARVYRARQQGNAGQNLQGRVWEGVTRNQRRPRRHYQHRPEHRRLAHLTGWTHDALQEIATMHHNTATWSDIVCTEAQPADVLAFATPRTSQARSSSITAAVWRWSSAPS